MLLLDWNLMKSSENCLNVKMIRIDFEEVYLNCLYSIRRRVSSVRHARSIALLRQSRKASHLSRAVRKVDLCVFSGTNTSVLGRVVECMISLRKSRMIFTTLGSTGKNLVLILLERRRKYGRQCQHCGPIDCCLVSTSGLEAWRCDGDVSLSLRRR